MAVPVAHPGQKHLARRNIIIAGLICVLTACALAVKPSGPGEDTQNVSESTRIPLALKLEDKSQPDGELTTEDQELQTDNTLSDLPWHAVTVKSGDNLSTLFKRQGLSASTLYQLTQTTPEAKALTRIFPGHTLEFQINDNHELLSLRHIQSRLESTLYRKIDGGFTAEHIVREPEIRQQFKTASIDDSLFLAGQQAGLSQNHIMELANIFSGVIDFIYDPRKGDSFNVLYEELYLDGEKIGNGNILAAEYNLQGERFVAYRYTDEHGRIGYYNEKGVSMRKAFLRAPLDFTRISSGFNLRRQHPIHKMIRAHRGVDYAAPTGTPVFAAGDGRVLKAGYTKANGNYIFLSHGSQYVTKYLHLQKKAVRTGQKVKQRQIIGYVGSTGYATGPHLHYEFLVNGVHRNPRTILQKLPKAESLQAGEIDRFVAQTTGLRNQLAQYQRSTQLALAELAAHE